MIVTRFGTSKSGNKIAKIKNKIKSKTKEESENEKHHIKIDIFRSVLVCDALVLRKTERVVRQRKNRVPDGGLHRFFGKGRQTVSEFHY